MTIAERLMHSRARRGYAMLELKRAQDEARDLILEARGVGLTLRAIGELSGYSGPRVLQIEQAAGSHADTAERPSAAVLQRQGGSG